MRKICSENRDHFNPSDVPGAIFVVLKMDPTFKIITEDLIRGKLSIAFARTKGGSDIQSTIDTNVVENLE